MPSMLQTPIFYNTSTPRILTEHFSVNMDLREIITLKICVTSKSEEVLIPSLTVTPAILLASITATPLKIIYFLPQKHFYL